MERYQRQMLLPEIGEAGQQKLKDAKVLIIGAGGLGSPAALYLAGAGIGMLGIVDDDVVSMTNLHRQIIHKEQAVGINKAESAKQNLAEFHSEVIVKTYPFRLNEENAEEIIEQYDFVLDAVDNFEAKFLINDICVKLGKAFCHAGVIRFQGQIFTHVPDRGPCYRCIFEEVPEKGTVPTASEVGIIGPIAGIMGCMQAMEAIKYIVGFGELLTGKMYILDIKTMEGRIARFPKKTPGCKACDNVGNSVYSQEKTD